MKNNNDNNNINNCSYTFKQIKTNFERKKQFRFLK